MIETKDIFFKEKLDKFKEAYEQACKEKKLLRAVFQGNKNYLEKFTDKLASPNDNDLNNEDKKKKEEQREKEQSEIINRRLKALCANWLKMQNVVCLIGSGASIDVGCLLGSMRNITAQYLENIEDEKLKTIFEKFFPSDPKTEEAKNFEICLSRLVSFSNMLESDLDLIIKDKDEKSNEIYTKENINKLIQIIQSVIFYCCNLKLPKDNENNTYNTHKQFIRKLIGRTDPKLKRVKLVTTNYDTLLEQAMDDLGVLYMDGFVGTVNRKFDTSCYGLDYYYPGEQASGNVARYDKFLHLYKVHGSINWWGAEKEEITWKSKDNLPVFCRPYSKQKPINPLLFEMIDEVYKNLSKDSNKWLGIQPTSIKYSETLNMPYSHLFRYFANALKEPQTVCFVIGYSFGDTHINNLIYDAMANPSFNLVIISPSLSKEIQNILEKEQLERVFWFGGEFGKFETFVKDLMPDLDEIKTEIQIQKMLRDLKNIDNGKPTTPQEKEEMPV
jgi:SIR2-like domain